MALLYPMLLSLLLVTCPSHADDPAAEAQVVEPNVGGDAILPSCHLDASLDRNVLVKWERKEEVVHFYRSGADDNSTQNATFKGRTSLFHHELDKGNTSLKLTNVTEQDAGLYTCTVRYKKLSRKCYVKLKPVKISDTENQHGKSASGDENSSKIVIAVVVVAIVAAVVIAIVASVVRKKLRNRRAGVGRQEEYELAEVAESQS